MKLMYIHINAGTRNKQVKTLPILYYMNAGMHKELSKGQTGGYLG